MTPHSDMEFTEGCQSLLVFDAFFSGLIENRLFNPGSTVSSLHSIEANTPKTHLYLNSKLHRLFDALAPRIDSFTLVEGSVEALVNIVPLIDPDPDRGTIIGHGRRHAGLQDNAADGSRRVTA